MMLLEHVLVLGYPGIHKAAITSQGELVAVDEMQSVIPASPEAGRFAIMPGFFDAHIHGYAGVDFSDPDLSFEKLMHLTDALGRTGLSYCLATFVSSSDELIQRNSLVLNDWIKHQQHNQLAGHTQILGLHFEGPFISHGCKGAHCAQHVQSQFSFDMFSRWCDLASDVRWIKMTISPDLEGAIDFIQQVNIRNAAHKAQTIQLFIGHSNASSMCVDAAMREGVRGFTHLGNANQERVHREQKAVRLNDVHSDVVRWAIDPQHATLDYGIELITDGKHISDEFTRLVHLHQQQKILLVSDALGASGLANGEYLLGDIAVLKKGNAFYIKDSDVLAGSAMQYKDVVAHYAGAIQKTHIHLWQDIHRVAVVNPRRFSLGEGIWLPEDRFNFVMMDEHGKVKSAWVSGKRAEL